MKDASTEPGPFVWTGTKYEGQGELPWEMFDRWEAPCGCKKYCSQSIAGTVTADACPAHTDWGDRINGDA
jgi:hypothetical protein